MPKVSQEHLDARRQQIVDAARVRFAGHGFARTSMADIVAASGLSNGAIYRYFTSKDDLIVAVCEQGTDALPSELTATTIAAFFDHVRARAAESGHARLVAQIYAEAAVSPALAEIVREQLASVRAHVAGLVPARRRADAGQIAEAFVALSMSYNQQLAVRGDFDPAPFTAALVAIIDR
ncbi:TetR/AcrR family transcriptional regulator [Kineosporia sp. J2-2]|uniref:TetR/AcrR family transcriptional regulator n=1 Tax=Kineosporia corallincola TaxID=2835133 RepID=A0ABS5TE07_9ACTN|nr:TetR/AcrR family transcriptional regulator [Kineosporia corallincola]MBT0768659.1 TetR/AcrR family transcriptional regulator [Kineosporia corallincola]